MEREQNSTDFGNRKVQADIIGLRKYPLKLHNQDIVSEILEHVLQQEVIRKDLQFLCPDT